MNKLFSALLWLAYGLSFIPSFLFAFLIRIFTFMFDPHHRLPNAVMMFFGKSIIVLNPLWKRHYHNLEKLTDGKPGMIRIANHQSFLDMPLLATLPVNMKWVSKKELFKIPIVGWLMYSAGHISVDRGSKGAAKSLLKMKAPIKDGTSVMIFPEGTRTRDGNLKPFKKGAFHASIDNQFPIQPLVVEGTFDCIKPDTWEMNLRGDLHVSVLDPVYPADFDSVNTYAAHVHQLVSEELTRLRKLKASDKR
ncbi:1-acyl-sn-glycerol-3-phosphate acyltransferase [Cyclonatronum proteinivorum]|uniref:1-acyl-sn-glycerol-3-phosphate acyltransferase n=1 Tax=Cyclonatronum proteinivorum TaxID=1457365 RepID=A0A345ULJ2_9BACT|nr:lysophospholipid acyltransferase family protein [Cyclonatronum proteinivorum]AXJ01344.1 1-acyl-sn-glycerol-3-phosphate acyltransferase [Cyclonatronum proteinivorum]